MQMPEMLDNVSKTVKDDLAATIAKGDKLSIAAACFSIYAYQALKKQLDGIEELRFIFTSPTFLQEKTPKAKREFYIPRLDRERSMFSLRVCGMDFVVYADDLNGQKKKPGSNLSLSKIVFLS